MKRGIATSLTELARTRRLIDLRHRHGTRDNPCTHTPDEWTEHLKRLTDRLKEQFDWDKGRISGSAR